MLDAIRWHLAGIKFTLETNSERLTEIETKLKDWASPAELALIQKELDENKVKLAAAQKPETPPA